MTMRLNSPIWSLPGNLKHDYPAGQLEAPRAPLPSSYEVESDLWNLSDTDAETVEVVSLSQPRAEGRSGTGTRGGKSAKKTAKATLNLENLKTVNMIQRVEGKEVFNSEVTAAVNADNQVISVAGQFFSGAGRADTRSRARGAAPRCRRSSLDCYICGRGDRTGSIRPDKLSLRGVRI